MSNLKTPPHSQEAEDAVIGSVLLSPDVISNIDLKPLDFFDRRNSILWKAFLDMRAQCKPIDAITFGEHLKDINSLDEIGGYDRLVELQDSVLVPCHSVQYADKVKKLSIARSEIGILQGGLAVACKGESASTSVMAALTGISTQKEEDFGMDIHAKNFVERCVAGDVGSLDWWCPEWTEKMGKLESELVILHAPRSTGKTAIMLQWITETHKSGGVAPLVSIEMQKKTLAQRFIANIGQVCTFAMKSRGYVTPEEKVKSGEAIKTIRALDIRVRDGEASIDDIFQYAITENNRKKLDVIWIDNLLCINDGGKNYQSKTIMYDAFIKKFRELRNVLGVPVIILAHPNADGNIAWSKDVENIADIIIYLERVPDEGVMHKLSGKFIEKKNFVEGRHIIAVFQKNRDGTQPVASLDFDGALQTFRHIGWEIDE